MENIIIKDVANNLNIKPNQVQVVLDLLKDNNTIPFIARYRQQQTGGLDENIIFDINKLYEYEINLKQRKEDVIRLIGEKGLLNDDIEQSIIQAKKIVEVDQIYQPYKDKKETKASKAIKLGLEALSKKMMDNPNFDIESEASKYLNDKVSSTEDAIQMASDIIAQVTCENSKVRDFVLENVKRHVRIVSKVKKNHDDEKGVYSMYYDYEQLFSKIANHQLLGLNRANKQKVVTISFVMPEDHNVENIYKYFFSKKEYQHKKLLIEAIQDGYKRLLFPSITRQLYSLALEEAMIDAIDLFALNLENLLMMPPIKNKVILGFDPAYKTGCKLAVVDESGNLLGISLIFPFMSEQKVKESKDILLDLISKYQINLIAIGNGTASRESEEFIANFIKEYKLDIEYLIVSEAGASVYSASKLAQDEFKDLKVEQRSAISIARRVLDPLGELIKIDPKSIGVGQYQHDVNQKQLSEKLEFKINKIVNDIGVDLNSSSYYLLSHISGLSTKIGKAIVEYRRKNNGFKNRNELLKVSGLKSKAFEQAAGFLRIESSNEILDKTIIHPESYKLVYKLLNELNLNIEQINDESFKKQIEDLNLDKYLKILDTDIYTLKIIQKGLLYPNLDKRDLIPTPKLRKDVLTINDLSIGMELEGVVRNIVDFGAFVDIGIKNDGLLHISKISKEFIKHPSLVLAINDIIKVKIDGIDLVKEKVSLTRL